MWLCSVCHVQGYHKPGEKEQRKGGGEQKCSAVKVLQEQGTGCELGWDLNKEQGQRGQAGNGDGADELAAAVAFQLPLPRAELATGAEHCTSSCLHGQREVPVLETGSFSQDTKSRLFWQTSKYISHFTFKDWYIWKAYLTKSQLIWIFCTRIYIAFEEKLLLKAMICNSKMEYRLIISIQLLREAISPQDRISELDFLIQI